ncbi:MAG: PAS domain-containing protein [Candidatus Angelobacter sp.]
MWVFDRQSLAFIDVNEAALQQYGYSREEFLTMRIVDIRPPKDVSALMRQTRFPLGRSARLLERTGAIAPETEASFP